jgi:hypothetical protein
VRHFFARPGEKMTHQRYRIRDMVYHVAAFVC